VAKPGSQNWIVGHGGRQLHPQKGWSRPAQKAEEFAASASYRASVVFYAVVSDEIQQVIEFFRTPAEAEAMLGTVLEDEPHLRDLLYVDRVELVTGGLN